MPHLLALGFEVPLEGGFGGDGCGDALNHFNPGGLERADLVRVVGHKADASDAEVLEDFGGQLKVAVVGLVA